MKVVIVGGVAAGGSAAARLRRLDEEAEIVVLERDDYVSFANCGLPYHIGGAIPDRGSLLLQTAEGLGRSLALDVRNGHRVERIDRPNKRVHVVDRVASRRYELSYDKLVLCSGAVPNRPPIVGSDHPRVHVLRTIPDMDRIIAQLDAGASRGVVIGGSYIGLEVAEAFRERGLDTTILERADRLMPWMDPEMTRLLHYHVHSHGVDVRLNTTASSFNHDGATTTIVCEDGNLIEADLVVLATGTHPDVELARAAGLAVGPLGGLQVDAHMRTSDPDILAAGDMVETSHVVTGQPTLSGLAGPANRQGRIAADTIAGRASAYRGTQGTAVVKVFEMTAGGTGLTQSQLEERAIPFKKVHLHPNGHASYYPGTSPMFMKVMFTPEEGKLLGAQVVGWDGIDKRIDVLAVALRAGMTVHDLEHLELCYAPPYGSAKDPVNMAGFLGANLLRGDVDFWYAEDFPACQASATILDVRTAREHAHWHIPGALHIPHTELRGRLDEVPTDRPVYAYCRSGFRSYLAYRVLKQSGFEGVATLAGGLMTFHAYHRTPMATGRAGVPVVPHAEGRMSLLPGALDHA
jgi:NADPH-dependent 2,4-dienoyl-CoA reductase/sulfur reductase-like enzyme/rhodanese-related sulfurtransferase